MQKSPCTEDLVYSKDNADDNGTVRGPYCVQCIWWKCGGHVGAKEN